MKGALRALVHRTTKVVLIVTRQIACFTGLMLYFIPTFQAGTQSCRTSNLGSASHGHGHGHEVP